LDLDDRVVDDDLALQGHHDLCPADLAAHRRRRLGLSGHLKLKAKYTLSIEIVKSRRSQGRCRLYGLGHGTLGRANVPGPLGARRRARRRPHQWPRASTTRRTRGRCATPRASGPRPRRTFTGTGAGIGFSTTRAGPSFAGSPAASSTPAITRSIYTSIAAAASSARSSTPARSPPPPPPP